MRADHWQARLIGVERELALIECPLKRDDVWRECVARCMKSWPGTLLLSLTGVLGIVALVAIYQLAAKGIQIPAPYRAMLPWSVIGVTLVLPTAVGLSHVFLLRRHMRRFIREAVRNEGIPLCLQCGYNLTGIAEARCPECGNSG